MWFILSLLDPSPAQDKEQLGLKRQDTPLTGEDPRVLASISHGGEDTDDSQYETDEEQDDEFPESEDDNSPEFAGKEMSIFIRILVSVVHFFIPSRYSPSQIASVSKVFKLL